MESTELNEGIRLTGQALRNLNETRKWTMFISIFGFVMVGFMLIMALFAGSFLSNLPNAQGMPTGIFSFIYILIALLYFFPIYYLYKFSAHMKLGIVMKSEQEVEDAFKHLKSHYKFMGILLAIVLAFYVLIFFGSVLFGTMLSM
ncbi:DUF5362 family protein [Fulvivirga lutimaris]|uniref:DUF5362 family protein n=1 Tax=Fulvivirga lutimaris TaxID=1819566 RepID=UPI0012BBD091|nr:DUF5362 family protein [Fulvivirga lutimaris]MTI38474.1 hypothetical protein [Fulvivirga lutimaris]